MQNQSVIIAKVCKKNDRYFYTAKQTAIKCCKNSKKHRKYKKLLQIPVAFARLQKNSLKTVHFKRSFFLHTLAIITL